VRREGFEPPNCRFGIREKWSGDIEFFGFTTGRIAKKTNGQQRAISNRSEQLQLGFGQPVGNRFRIDCLRNYKRRAVQ
jgi:hypothetical protein